MARDDDPLLSVTSLGNILLVVRSYDSRHVLQQLRSMSTQHLAQRNTVARVGGIQHKTAASGDVFTGQYYYGQIGDLHCGGLYPAPADG